MTALGAADVRPLDYFVDPDGIRLEVVAHRRLRSLVVERWASLREFEDPLRKAGPL
jgi:hypothetical protein